MVDFYIWEKEGGGISVMKHFLSNSLMKFALVVIFSHARMMFYEYFPLGFSTEAECVSYKMIPWSLIQNKHLIAYREFTKSLLFQWI